MSLGGWSLAAVHDVVAAAIPDREMIVCGDVRRTFADVAERTRSIAAFLTSRGLGVRRERHELERWENGQDPVALVLHNCPEYIEAMLGAYRARAVPFNVNQHYRASEVGALFTDIGVRAVGQHLGAGRGRLGQPPPRVGDRRLRRAQVHASLERKAHDSSEPSGLPR